MNSSTIYSVPMWPIVVYFIAVILVVTGITVLSYFMGQRHQETATQKPYESGIASTGSARVRFDVRFYLVAMFFVIFDLETVFIFGWAVAVRELGRTGYYEMLVFIGILVIVLIYLWRLGALDWGPTRLRPGADRQEE
jgi:NADH-quinone oxidoreductase subunit A